ncbi:DeoR/GlpR family DNA-binding transcription regulator [Ruania rhizosphaerae]|uniref:DeoR/GlpR family DNA-binding transcription regulator n=1 Tax=Ruania rhizosphaerae TaxID=1840413 RepID=UPI00190F7BB1|nr:DeoR/GlpR family DNA-binding transcription regulator [Ruania rhizosphaerae]
MAQAQRSGGRKGRAPAEVTARRRNRIVDLVQRDGSVSIEELGATFGVSTVTIYRDLADLESLGMIVRQRGVVTAAGSNLQEAPARFRLGQNEPAKLAIARHAAAMVPRGSAVMLDDSTTGVLTARELREFTPLTVVTNSLLVAEEVRASAGMRLVLTGGEYEAWAEALLGPIAAGTVASLAADVCLVSVSGITDGVTYHPYAEVAAVKKAMMRASARSVALIDHTKFRRRALHEVAPLTAFDTVVTDRGTSREVLELLREGGVNVEVAPDIG